MTDSRAAGLELGARVAGDDAVELGVSERTLGFDVRLDEELAPDVRPVDDGGQRNRRLGADASGQFAVDRHQSSSSMNSRIVPPHVRPTANASSSL